MAANSDLEGFKSITYIKFNNTYDGFDDWKTQFTASAGLRGLLECYDEDFEYNPNSTDEEEVRKTRLNDKGYNYLLLCLSGISLSIAKLGLGNASRAFHHLELKYDKIEQRDLIQLNQEWSEVELKHEREVRGKDLGEKMRCFVALWG